MGAHEDIISSFRELVLDLPYEKITVSEICERAGVSRKTFYSHFQSKYSIVSEIVRENVLSQVVRMNAVIPTIMGSKSMLDEVPGILNTDVYQAVYDDREFYSRLCNQAGSMDSPLVEALIENIAIINNNILDSIGTVDEPWKRDIVAYYFAAGNAIVIQRWMRSGFQASAQEVAKLYDELTTPYWKKLAGVTR